MSQGGVHTEEAHSGLYSTGHGLHVRVQAFCQCGWTGPQRPWIAGARDAERSDLAAHLAAAGHQEFPSIPAPDGYHLVCGHFHDLNDSCPLPPDSPRGRLERLSQSGTPGRPERALDRLRAIEEFRAWLDDEERRAAIGARTARCTWTEMGEAIGATRQAAWNRWGQMIAGQLGEEDLGEDPGCAKAAALIAMVDQTAICPRCGLVPTADLAYSGRIAGGGPPVKVWCEGFTIHASGPRKCGAELDWDQYAGRWVLLRSPDHYR